MLSADGSLVHLNLDVCSGHAFSDAMVKRATAFLCEHGLGQKA